MPRSATVTERRLSKELPEPRTELGRRLSELRAEITESGVRLLTLDEVNAELEVDRGERDQDVH